MGSRASITKWLSPSAWLLYAMLSLVIAWHAIGYLYAEIDLRNPFHRSFASAGLAVPGHFFFAGLALLLAPMQLLAGLRLRWPAFHRAMGWVYVACVMMAGVAGVLLSPRTQGGWSTGASFLLLAILWMAITGRAVQLAVQRRIVGHRRWMLRSVALTFSAVTLRLILALGVFGLGLGMATSYLIASWLCWTLNLSLMELYLRRSGSRAANADSSAEATAMESPINLRRVPG